MLSSLYKHCLNQSLVRSMSISISNKFGNISSKTTNLSKDLFKVQPKNNSLALFEQNRHHGGAIGKPGAPKVNFKVIDRNGLEHEIAGRVSLSNH